MRERLDRVLRTALAALLGLAVANVVWQVFTRFVLGDPSGFTDELARYLLIWLGLLGAAYATGRHRHVALDLWSGASEAGRLALDRFRDLATLVFGLGVLGIGGARLVWLTFALDQRSAALGLPLGVVYLALPLAGATMAAYALLDLRAERRATGEPAP